MPAARLVTTVLVATPLTATAGLPTSVPSILNWTVPVGVPAPGAVAVTVAVNCTPCPKTEGLMSALTVVVVPALLTTWPVDPWLELKSLVPT